MPRFHAFLRLLPILLIGFAVLSLTGCGGAREAWDKEGQKQTPAEAPPVGTQAVASTPNAAPLPPVKVALLVPLTGRNAQIGKAMLNAAQMALFDVGYDSFQLLPRDTKGTAAGASAAATQAVQDGAQLFLGPVFAEEVNAAKEPARAAHVSMIAFSTNWELTDQNTFIMGFMPFDQIERIVNYAAAHNIQRIGLIAPSTDYGRAVMSAWRTMTARANILTPQAITIDPEGDYAQAVTKFAQDGAASGLQAVFLPIGGGAAAKISGLLAQSGLPSPQVRRIGSGLFDDDALATNPAMEGAWFAAPPPAERRNFEQKFMNNYGYIPPRLTTLAYDATALAAALAQRGAAAGAPAFDRNSIMNPNGFAGLDGIFRFRQTGLAERGLAVLEFRNGHAVVIDQPPGTFQTAP